MYELEIETKNNLEKIRNPRKARIADRIFFDSLQIMDDSGKWHTVCCCVVGVSKGQIIIDKIEKAINKKQPYVYVDI